MPLAEGGPDAETWWPVVAGGGRQAAGCENASDKEADGLSHLGVWCVVFWNKQLCKLCTSKRSRVLWEVCRQTVLAAARRIGPCGEKKERYGVVLMGGCNSGRGQSKMVRKPMPRVPVQDLARVQVLGRSGHGPG